MSDEAEGQEELARLREENERLKAEAEQARQAPPATPAEPPPPPYAAPPRRGPSGCVTAIAIVAGLFVIVLLAAALLPGSKPPKLAGMDQVKAAQEQEDAPKLYEAGQPVPAGDLSARIDSVREFSRINGYVPTVASEGGEMVAVKYSVLNVSAKPVSAGDMPEIHLVDGAGTIYSKDSGKTGAYEMADPTDTKLWSDLNPGITTHGVAVFEVSTKTFDRVTWRIMVGDDGPLVGFPPKE